MATPTDISLLPCSVVIQQGNVTDLSFPTLNGLAEGTVRQVYSTSDRVAVGYTVVFNTKNADIFKQSGTTYYVVNENDIKIIYTGAAP